MILWDEHSIERDKCSKITIGTLKIWVTIVDDEIHIGTQKKLRNQTVNSSQALFERNQPLPKGLEWTRYIADKNSSKLTFKPAMPDRAVVVRPAQPLKLPPGRKAVFYVGVPIAVRIEAPELNGTVLAEIPTAELSNIWFGDPLAGQLCYSLTSKASRQFIDLQKTPNIAVCPVTVGNKSKEMIDIERICVQTQHLAIYEADEMMWTSDIKIEFQSADYTGSVIYSSLPAELKEKAKLLTPAKVPKRRTFIEKGLKSFRIWQQPDS